MPVYYYNILRKKKTSKGYLNNIGHFAIMEKNWAFSALLYEAAGVKGNQVKILNDPVTVFREPRLKKTIAAQARRDNRSVEL